MRALSHTLRCLRPSPFGLVALSALCLLVAMSAPCRAQDAEFVLVTPEGIIPQGAVATISNLASNMAFMAATDAALTATSNAVAQVDSLIDGVAEVINGLEGIGYIRGYMLDFGVSDVEINTNATATIIRYDHNVAQDPGIVYSDLYTYFSEEPGELPVVRWSSSPREDALWEELESVSVTLTTITVGGTSYECYRNRVAIPEERAAAFFRVFAEAYQVQVGAFLPVRNGIRVGGQEPLTGEFVVGGETIKFVGGIRVAVPD